MTARDEHLWAVVLAGGIGARFWPMSTPDRPKQLLPLVDDAPLLANTVDRLAPLVPAERTLILACILPSSLSKSARPCSSGSARTPVRSTPIA